MHCATVECSKQHTLSGLKHHAHKVVPVHHNSPMCGGIPGGIPGGGPPIPGGGPAIPGWGAPIPGGGPPSGGPPGGLTGGRL